MFCSYCGHADQAAGKYCRGCGKYLPDNSFGSFNWVPPQSVAGWIIVGNCLGLAMFLIACPFFLFSKSFPLSILSWALAGGAWGEMLVATVYAFILYRRLRRMRGKGAKTLEKVDSTQAHHSLAADDTSRIVEVESATERTTALLKMDADTERDG